MEGGRGGEKDHLGYEGNRLLVFRRNRGRDREGLVTGEGERLSALGSQRGTAPATMYESASSGKTSRPEEGAAGKRNDDHTARARQKGGKKATSAEGGGHKIIT